MLKISNVNISFLIIYLKILTQRKQERHLPLLSLFLPCTIFKARLSFKQTKSLNEVKIKVSLLFLLLCIFPSSPYKTQNSILTLNHTSHFLHSNLSLPPSPSPSMDALNFLKFWKNVTATNTDVSHLVLEEADDMSDDEDSFFDLELSLHDFDIKENNITNKTIGTPEDQIMQESESILVSIHQEDNFSSKIPYNININDEVDISKPSTTPLSSNESISKRKIHPIEPISKPQSPISLLRSSAPSFRISMFKKPKEKEAKNYPITHNMEKSCYNSPALSRVNSSRNKINQERSSKDVLQKYVKLLKPLYMKVSRKYNDKTKFGDEVSSNASPMSSPSASSVSSFSRKEKHVNIPAGIKVVRKHLGKSKSAPSAFGVSSPSKRSDDSLWEQNDGIQSAILHCKKSFNGRGKHYFVVLLYEYS